MIPCKMIKSAEMMPTWFKSSAYKNLMNLITEISQCVMGKSYNQIKSSSIVSKNVEGLISVLDKLFELIEKHPPEQQSQRFGNKSYRRWFREMKTLSPTLFDNILIGENEKRYLDTLMVYFTDCFGNESRIDYGTGHEANLFFFLSCLNSIGVLSSNDHGSIFSMFFTKYLDLVRKLQRVYRIEPAGSHGVWGLDDFQFLPFLFGSSQLIGHSEINPSMYPNAKYTRLNKDGWMFLEGIDNINQNKTGPFFEHSSYLYNISAVNNWAKVNKGLILMYQKEVLSKFPIVQHFYFGDLMPLN